MESAVRIQLSAGPPQRAVAVAGEALARATLAKAFGPFRRPGGSYHQDNVFRFLIARA